MSFFKSNFLTILNKHASFKKCSTKNRYSPCTSASDLWQSLWGCHRVQFSGPTLFSLYINNVALAAFDSLSRLYADDTILYTSGPSLDTVLNLQMSFNAIQHSLRGLQLFLNASKTKCMLFNRSLPAPARPTSITTLDGSDLWTICDMWTTRNT